MIASNDVQNSGITVPTVTGSQLAMHNLGNKLARGAQLNTNESFQAVSLAAEDMREAFGPGPADMQPKPVELPESTKGVLADYAG